MRVKGRKEWSCKIGFLSALPDEKASHAGRSTKSIAYFGFGLLLIYLIHRGLEKMFYGKTVLSGVLVEATKAGSTNVYTSATTNASGYLLLVEADTIYNLKFTKAGYEEQIRTNVNVGKALTMDDVIMVPATTEPPFAGGSGTATDPYLLTDPAHLDAVRTNLSAHYKLDGNIDLASWGNWEPIGTLSVKQYQLPISYDYDNAFSGVFDGNGYEIKNMTSTGGLFGCLYTATVKNIGVANSTVNSTGSAGGIAKSAFSSVISNCRNMGTVTGTATETGGIAGYIHNSKINNCYNTGTISTTVTNAGACAGGIVGYSVASEITNCNNKGAVRATSNLAVYAGGIVGRASNHEGLVAAGSTVIKLSYNTGSIEASYTGTSTSANAGGVVGNAGGGDYSLIVENCYNIGKISLTSSVGSVGGIIGGQANSTVRTCYNIGIVERYNAITGYANFGAVVTDCYYLNDSGYPHYVGNGTFTNVLPLVDAQMKQQASFVGFDFGNVWAINPAINNGYPYLRGMQP